MLPLRFYIRQCSLLSHGIALKQHIMSESVSPNTERTSSSSHNKLTNDQQTCYSKLWIETYSNDWVMLVWSWVNLVHSLPKNSDATWIDGKSVNPSMLSLGSNRLASWSCSRKHNLGEKLLCFLFCCGHFFFTWSSSREIDNQITRKKRERILWVLDLQAAIRLWKDHIMRNENQSTSCIEIEYGVRRLRRGIKLVREYDQR